MQSTAKHLRPLPSPAGEVERLFQEHHDQIFRTAYRITGSAGDAEDVLQTVFLRLVGRKQKLDLAPSPGGYLHRAAINASLDVLRHRTKSRYVSIEEVPGELIESPGLSPEALHSESELRSRIRTAVARLGAKAAEVVALKYFEGYGNQEIARLLGTSEMVVAVILHRARTRLRKEIGKFLEENHEAN